MGILDGIDLIIGQARHGAMHRFEFDTAGGHSGRDAEMTLRQYHIPIWGRGAAKGRRWFYVKWRQAMWAEYLLVQAGIPLTSPLLDPRHAGVQRKGLPPAWSDGMAARGLADTMHDVMDKTVGWTGPRMAGRVARRRERRRQ